MNRLDWIDMDHSIATTNQCELAGVSRSTLYARQKQKLIDAEDLLLCALIDEEYTRHPFYGSRRMVVILARAGHIVNRKRVQRLMRQMGLAGMAPGPNTSRPHPGHKVYPYSKRSINPALSGGGVVRDACVHVEHRGHMRCRATQRY